MALVWHELTPLMNVRSDTSAETVKTELLPQKFCFLSYNFLQFITVTKQFVPKVYGGRIFMLK